MSALNDVAAAIQAHAIIAGLSINPKQARLLARAAIAAYEKAKEQEQ